MEKLFLALLVFVAITALTVDAKAKKKKKAPVEFDVGDSFSNLDHFADSKHDPKYDHDAFLGEDQAASMHGLSRDEVREKLKEMFPKIDINKDKKISRKELTEWIVDNVKKHVSKNTKERLADMDTNKDGKVSWEEFKSDHEKHNTGEGEGDDNKLPDQIAQEEKKFRVADSDGDNALNEEQLAIFLHPEESPRMISLLVEENLAEMDKDGDGKISFDEYTGVGNDGQIDKESLDSLRETFNNELDKNKDGSLDREEVKHWVFPGGDDDPAVGEADHLMKEVDTNKDGQLSLKEILDNQDMFAGGRTTLYGELLKNEL